ncbi:MAG: peptidoglycan glycosyltransferase FtsI [Arsenophonus sp.]|nr:MAG: peptidoglycan glycosyltransferase FtsI [Arsenophonus sp.]
MKQKIKYIKLRFFLLFTSVGLILIILIFRITYLQIINTKDLTKQGNMRSIRTLVINNLRGMIYDRNGKKLAISIPVYAICADPKKIIFNNMEIKEKKWKELSEIINIPVSSIKKKIQINSKNRFIYLARQIHYSNIEYILKLKINGIFLKKETKRYYPLGKITAHLIGITDIDGNGIEGIEKSFDQKLSGKPGKKIIRTNKQGHIIENLFIQNDKKPDDLTLSIDSKIQSLTYYELENAVKKNKAESGTAIVVDIKTGEILAMVNSPSYNPNNFIHTANQIIRNRAITDLFEPGSTIKPIVMIGALYNGMIKDNSIIDTNPYFINKYKIKDVKLYHSLSVTEILKKSSNVGISKIALKLSDKELIDTYSQFGLGKSTNLGLIGEQNGILPKNKKLSKIQKATFSFGYGFMVTPLQLIKAYTIIGNLGIYIPLSILKVEHPIIEKKIYSESIIRTIIKMLESVSLPGGAGVKASIQGYRIAIKTGTVKIVNKQGKYINEYVAYTVGIAPASNPKYALIVLINKPKTGKYYGGIVSAPIFKNIMKSILHLMQIKPDQK